MDLFQSLLDEFLPQQFAECIEDDAVADAKEEVERSRNDALTVDGEEAIVAAVAGVRVLRLAILCAAEQIVRGDAADGAWMRGGGILETQHGVDEWPVAIEKGLHHIDDALQHGKGAATRQTCC